MTSVELQQAEVEQGGVFALQRLLSGLQILVLLREQVDDRLEAYVEALLHHQEALVGGLLLGHSALIARLGRLDVEMQRGDGVWSCRRVSS